MSLTRLFTGTPSTLPAASLTGPVMCFPSAMKTNVKSIGPLDVLDGALQEMTYHYITNHHYHHQVLGGILFQHDKDLFGICPRLHNLFAALGVNPLSPHDGKLSTKMVSGSLTYLTRVIARITPLNEALLQYAF